MICLKTLFIALILSVSSALAQEETPPSNEFLSPNEVNPELAKPILTNAPIGAYIAVGTERGFIHAADAKEVTHLFLVDRAPGTVLFNKINKELLRAAWKPGMSVSDSRERYRFLRLEGSFEDWQNVSENFELISQRKNYDWFTKSARGRGFFDFNSPPKASRLAAFRNANYLFDDKMFGKLQKMALEGKIESYQLDFGSSYGQYNQKAVEDFLARLEQKKIPISVFDLSNAWSQKYLSPEWTALLEKTLAASPMARPDSIFVVTDYRRIQFYKNGERAKAPWITFQATTYATNAHNEYDWEYHGYTFDFLNSHPLLKILNSSFIKGTSLNDLPLSCDNALFK
jgi:hypothetical protein